MALPQPIDPNAELDDAVATAARWSLDCEVVIRLQVLAKMLGWAELWIISGYRTAEEQRELERAGRPTAPDNVSTHRSCPATGVDIRIAGVVTDEMKLGFGRAAEASGFRWGGGSQRDPRGIPSDWNHLDLGRRVT